MEDKDTYIIVSNSLVNFLFLQKISLNASPGVNPPGPTAY